MGVKFGKGVKINGKDVQEKTLKKIITCQIIKCPFGKTKMDDYCAICHHRKDIPSISEIEPVFIEIKEQYIIKGCFKKDKIPLYGECPFGFKEASEKCIGCVRIQIQSLNIETKEIK